MGYIKKVKKIEDVLLVLRVGSIAHFLKGNF